eukprot:Partr_v1_DN28318_c0_g1_i2_m78329 putative RNA binding motif protein
MNSIFKLFVALVASLHVSAGFLRRKVIDQENIDMFFKCKGMSPSRDSNSKGDPKVSVAFIPREPDRPMTLETEQAKDTDEYEFYTPIHVPYSMFKISDIIVSLIDANSERPDETFLKERINFLYMMDLARSGKPYIVKDKYNKHTTCELRVQNSMPERLYLVEIEFNFAQLDWTKFDSCNYDSESAPRFYLKVGDHKFLGKDRVVYASEDIDRKSTNIKYKKFAVNYNNMLLDNKNLKYLIEIACRPSTPGIKDMTIAKSDHRPLSDFTDGNPVIFDISNILNSPKLQVRVESAPAASFSEYVKAGVQFEVFTAIFSRVAAAGLSIFEKEENSINSRMGEYAVMASLKMTAYAPVNGNEGDTAINVAPFIDELTLEAENHNDRTVYRILRVFLDGQIDDIEETKNAIVKASRYPLSIIFVGIGGLDMTQLEVLDGDDEGYLKDSNGLAATRDIVNSVQYNDYITGPRALSLGAEAMKEIPFNVVDYYVSLPMSPNDLKSIASVPHESHTIPSKFRAPRYDPPQDDDYLPSYEEAMNGY